MCQQKTLRKITTSRRLKAALMLCSWLFSSLNCIAKSADSTLDIVFFAQQHEVLPALSNLDPIISDKGLQGVRLGIKDNNTTGQFTGQKFRLTEAIIPASVDVKPRFIELIDSGFQHFIVNLPSDALLELAKLSIQKPILLYDAAGTDDSFRSDSCFANVLHLLPSRAMRADALAQYMLKKRWDKWFVVTGPAKQDGLYAKAIKRAAARYRMKIVKETIWEHSHDARRTAQSEVPVLTQGTDYHVLIVADEVGLFGEYFAYRTWIPRPIAGTQGLVPTAWHRTHEQWGAVQLQNRFKEQAGRWMVEEDYGAWLAARALGESATRQQSLDFEKIRSFLLSDKFALAGFKGKKLSFRRWNGQLRQPVLLAAARSMVAAPPLEGFLHPKNELDTLGFDEPESKCQQ